MNILTCRPAIKRRTVVIAAAIPALLSACALDQLPGPNYDSNSLTIEHAFSDEGVSNAAAEARRACAQRKQLVIQTQQACTLTRCRTSFQCIKSEDKAAYGL